MGAIYLDHNATTPLRPEAWDAMRPLMAEVFGNPASAHAFGRQARRALDDAREKVAGRLGAHPDEVTFTSGATEANNLAVFGLAEEPTLLGPPSLKGRGVTAPVASCAPNTLPPPDGANSPLPFREGGPGGVGFFASHLEHPCVVEPLRHLEARGARVAWLPADARGVIAWPGPPDGPALVCVMLANHETGAVQPVARIAASLPKGAHLHCDAAQAVGKIAVDFCALGATTLAASGHKFGGPKGVGVLLVRRGTALVPCTFGGHQQGGRRPGTEPVALAVGMAAALDAATRDLDATRATLAAHRARLWTALERDCAPVVLNGPEIGAPDVVPSTLNASFPGCRADLLLMSLDLAGVACSAGSACSSGSLLPSPVLRAMGVADEVLRSAVRFSFAPSQAADEIDDAVGRIARCVRATREG